MATNLNQQTVFTPQGPQLHVENPGAERYRPASRYERKDGGLRPAGVEKTKPYKEKT